LTENGPQISGADIRHGNYIKNSIYIHHIAPKKLTI